MIKTISIHPGAVKRCSALLLILLATTVVAGGQESRVFEFGRETHAVNTNIITEAVQYSSDPGFGFDVENREAVSITSAGKPLEGFCTAPVPFYFSVALPEGNYEVRVRIGNPVAKSVTTIKAESRRLMVRNLEMKKGHTEEVTFIVNIRSPRISGADSIRLKSREYNYMNWDNRLTLEFSGQNQAVQAIEIRPAKNVTTLYLAGNSTVTDQDREPWASWGQMITTYFDSRVAVANFAESGESLASFKSSRRLEKTLTLIQPGDYLLIEFGHNDQKRSGDGIGPWTTFTDLLTEFVTAAREKGAQPVLITPTQRRSFNDSGKISPTHGDYPAAMRKVAEALQVPLIDLNEMTKTLYEAWGPETSKKAFVHYPAGTFPGQEKELKDNTHFNAFGANEIALCILSGIMEQEIGLKEHIVNFPADYDPSAPTDPEKWNVPLSPRFVSKKPEGN
ncbi:MAG: rhamnogalacturonan acetylesterase [Bacteroidales bacterium]|nr:rhamnogalacturonan acetylesterase [Bacteroidales bacterium]MDT8430180.1 rhamnogalacturonan acetylesterase [Bacteroidales bacterium]